MINPDVYHGAASYAEHLQKLELQSFLRDHDDLSAEASAETREVAKEAPSSPLRRGQRGTYSASASHGRSWPTCPQEDQAQVGAHFAPPPRQGAPRPRAAAAWRRPAPRGRQLRPPRPRAPPHGRPSTAAPAYGSGMGG